MDGNKEYGWLTGDLYRKIVCTLYNRSLSLTEDKGYKDWKVLFSTIHGGMDSQRKVDTEVLANHFNISLNKHDDLFLLVFCLETYYSIVLRFLVYKAINPGAVFSMDAFDDDYYRHAGISNFKCPDNLNWFVGYKEMTSLLPQVYSNINMPGETLKDDLVSFIFESIFPKEIRHGLGEFYTPVWLASHIIETVTADDENRHAKRYLDPTCGSGAFLVALINKFKDSSNGMIFNSVCGIDINPLTVLAAKTNYILLYLDYYKEISQELCIPVYYSDTIQDSFGPALFADNGNEYDIIPESKFDYVVGNPPWVNWEYLPSYYKTKYSYLWKYYGLFKKKGLSSNFIKEDISVLHTYVAIDKYLTVNGKIAFVLKETLFKSIKQGEGFRNFYLAPSDEYIGVWQVDDLSKINPFRHAATRSALFYATKGKKTEYPVRYFVWRRDKKNKCRNQDKIKSDCFCKEMLLARPSDKQTINSGWITESAGKTTQSNAVLGSNDYVARTGTFTGGANGIFWIKILDSDDNTVVVRNITERAKNKMPAVTKRIEKDIVYPLLTGNELGFWEYSYSKYIICPHNAKSKMHPIPHEELDLLPLSKGYFECFKTELTNRKGFTSFDRNIHKKYYYTLQRIGEYSFAPYKVCWRYICTSFTPAVVEYADDPVLGKKNIICNEKIISIGLYDKHEAYYLCGLISSTPYRETIESYMVGTQITPGIINKLKIPAYDPDCEEQRIIAEECILGHESDENRKQHLQRIDDAVNIILHGK